MSLLLDHAGATVSVVHLQSTDPEKICREADILIVACGAPEAIGADRVKEGAVVVDVGIHRRPNGKLCGDVQFEEVSKKASWISPVPGGVGPMTICSLLENTWAAYQKRI
jgi:methylenetetrahydrofolate dehydrogenase (NADP+)/methenyltetrahydrofolate cyclohydrolase